jgi:hypothetical protein
MGWGGHVALNRPNFRQEAKMRASAAFIVAGVGMGTGLYFGNLVYFNGGIMPAERGPANSMVALLAESSTDRSAISAAYNDVSSCGPLLSKDQATFRQAASSRQRLITQLGAIPGVSALPATLVAELTAAWRASQQVDQDYARWAQDESAKAHCTPLDYFDVGYAGAVNANYQATVDKAAALDLWNPIAEQFSLPTYSQSQI